MMTPSFTPCSITPYVLADYQYMLFDPSLFEGAHDLLDGLGIAYHLLGYNLFDSIATTPTLVDLTRLNDQQRDGFWHTCIASTSSQGASLFDQMPIGQNLIQSDAPMDSMVSFLTQFMKITTNHEDYFFRFFDPRVGIHLNALLGRHHPKKYNPYAGKITQWTKHINAWVVSIAKGSYQLNFPLVADSAADSAENQSIPRLLNFDDIEHLNTQLREALTPQFNDEWQEIPFTEHAFSDAYTAIYTRIYGEQ